MSKKIQAISTNILGTLTTLRLIRTCRYALKKDRDMQMTSLKRTTAKTLGVAALMALTSGSASFAIEFSGADFEVMTSNSKNNTASIMRSNVTVDMGNGLSVQLGGAFKGGDGYDQINVLEAHISQNFSNGLTFGGFVGQEVWDGSEYNYSGLEVILERGAFTVELSASQYKDAAGSDVYEPVTIDFGYDLSESTTIIAGYATDTSANEDDTFSYIGAAYDVAPNVLVEATFGKDANWAGNTFGLGVKINFAKGTQMRQRNYAQYFPHY